MVKLQTSDKEIIEVESWIVEDMKMVQFFMDADEAEDVDEFTVFPIPNVTSHHLRLIIQMKVNKFDEGFVKKLSMDELKEVLSAAVYLDMRSIVDFVSQTIANIIKDKTPEFLRKLFGIVSDFTPEEEAALRETYAWTFEGVKDDDKDD